MFPASIYWFRLWQNGSETQVVKKNKGLMYRCLWSVFHCQLSTERFSLQLFHHTARQPHPSLHISTPVKTIFHLFLLFSFFLACLLYSISIVLVFKRKSLQCPHQLVAISPKVLSVSLHWWSLLLMRSFWEILTSNYMCGCFCTYSQTMCTLIVSLK